MVGSPPAFAAYGLPAPTLVQEQCAPDPDFPTVKYPNPEEGQGALQLSIATAGPGAVPARRSIKTYR